MKKIEIRWLERRTDIEETGVKSFIKTLDEPGLDSMSAVEKVFKEWLEKKVKGRKVIVSDVEIYVDGKLYPMEKTEENALYRRIGDAAGQ
jgi:hypothetical protein